MIISYKSEEELNQLFNGRIPWFQCEERNSYDGKITLYDQDEIAQDLITELHIGDTYDVCVGDSCEVFDSFQEAWSAYKRQACKYTSGI